MVSPVKKVCSFFVGDERYGVEVGEVSEVIRHGPLAPVPLAPPSVMGLINLRGRVATVVDLGARLGRPPAPAAGGLGVVLAGGRGLVSLRVDRIGDVVEVSEADFEPPPDNLRGGARALIRGAYKLPDGLLLLLDAERAIPAVGGPRAGA